MKSFIEIRAYVFRIDLKFYMLALRFDLLLNMFYMPRFLHKIVYKKIWFFIQLSTLKIEMFQFHESEYTIRFS